MCSIGGWISANPLPAATARRLAAGLLYYGQDRGKQSAGLWTDSRGLLKRAQSADDLVGSEPWCEYWDASENGVTICLTHTRQPTCGDLGDAQAQPFCTEDGKVVTVHNGMLTNMKELKALHEIDKPSGVDSELITSFVAAHSIDELHTFFTSAEGSSASAIVVGDKLYLARDGGPIEFTCIKLADGQELLLFASTTPQLMHAARYVWLMPTTTKTYSVEWASVNRVDPAGLTKISDVTSRYSSHRGSTYGGRYQGADDYDEGWGGRSHYSSSYKPSAPSTEVAKTKSLAAALDARSLGVPEDADARAADYSALGQRVATEVLTDEEAARLAYYVALEDVS